jgi:carbonic anhydrase/acetyltransferase-like protein (isoleucine patch superfamily)
MSENAAFPTVGPDVYIAPTAYVGGDVAIAERCTIMHHVTIRGDVSRITIGPRVNVQDGTVIHTKAGVPLEIEADVTIGHRAVVHGRRVGRGTLVGIGAILLDDSVVGEGCLIAAGAVVPPGKVVPDGKLVVGVPGRVLRDVTDDERAYLAAISQRYIEMGRRHAAGLYPNYASSGAGA